tara:strand:- start:943 stop:4617 length:3675 start_codon:yes stop_codon:yes gene_type:complete
MLNKIAGFEIGYQIKSPGFIAIFGIFFLLAFGNAASDFVQIGSTSAVNINSPNAITIITGIMSIFGMIIPTVFLVSGILRDSGFKTEEMFFTTRVKERDYLMGRFLGGFIVTALAFLSIPLGSALGAAMPWVDPENLGAFNLYFYAYPFFVLGLPNLLVAGLIMFTVANLTKSNVATYTALVAMFIAYFVASALTNNPDWREIVAVADPFGMNAFAEVTRYWTPAEQNTQVIPLEGTFLLNRAVWLGFAVVLFIINLAVFSFRRRKVSGLLRRKSAAMNTYVPTHIDLPKATPASGSGAVLSQFFARLGFEVKGVVFNVAFWVLMALGMFLAIFAMLFTQTAYGTPNYPLTRTTIDIVVGGFAWVPIVVIVYYASEVIWRERNYHFSDIVDASPTPSWVFITTKILALAGVVIALFSVAMLTGIGIQLLKGFTDIDMGQYALRLFYSFGIPFTMLAVLAIFFQVVFNNKWLGMLALIVFQIGQAVASNFGLDHNLYLFGGSPTAPYTDMNGYGHFLGIQGWFYLYWGAISLLLVVLSYLLWNRGALTPIWTRIGQLPRSFSHGSALLAGVAVITAGATGGWIFYNTNVLNEYQNNRMAERQSAEFERTYRADLEGLPQPRITDVSVDVDIYPEQRRYEAEGSYVVENKTDAPIETMWVAYGSAADVVSQSVTGARLTTRDDDFQMYAFTFDAPLQPGETQTLAFEVEVNNPGFRNSGNLSSVVDNGTFLNNGEAMPYIGFNRGALLQGRQARRRQGFEDELERAFPLEDETHWRDNYIRQDSDFVSFRTTVSTSGDQIAIAPGYLEREWTSEGRNYFEYVMDAPILNFQLWVSADYELREELVDGINFQIFYDAQHEWNVDRMMEAAQDSVFYFSEAFSPYQYRQYRVFEFPAYASFAQSFPNSIAYSEDIGFVADLRDPEDIDYVYYVTAHEAAHQWWAHQVISANVQGGTMLVETFAQYSALMVMEREYGEDHMRRFLKYELDNYLNARGNESREELPLYRVENQQYIHYRKGAVIMYALQDYIGEDTVNRAMSRLIDEFGFQGDPYARSVDFIRILREEAGPEWDELITDFFERIIVFDLMVAEDEGAVTRELEDGRWETTIRIEAHKYEADGLGEQTEEDIDYMIDIGLFTRGLDGAFEGTDHILYMEKHRINETEMTITLVTDERPLFAGIDPYNKLIDRNSDDNLRRVTMVSGSDSDETPAGDSPGDDATDTSGEGAD